MNSASWIAPWAMLSRAATSSTASTAPSGPVTPHDLGDHLNGHTAIEVEFFDVSTT
jgi:hypothetical protein